MVYFSLSHSPWRENCVCHIVLCFGRVLFWGFDMSTLLSGDVREGTVKKVMKEKVMKLEIVQSTFGSLLHNPGSAPEKALSSADQIYPHGTKLHCA